MSSVRPKMATNHDFVLLNKWSSTYFLLLPLICPALLWCSMKYEFDYIFIYSNSPPFLFFFFGCCWGCLSMTNVPHYNSQFGNHCICIMILLWSPPAPTQQRTFACEWPTYSPVSTIIQMAHKKMKRKSPPAVVARAQEELLNGFNTRLSLTS